MSVRGRFVTLEGGEGAGKSTQLRRLAASLRASGREVIETREPGGSPAAERIRALLVEGVTDSWDGVTEALLHYAARREHLRAVVWPELARGAWVLSDRFADSTLAYQGYGHGVDRAFIGALYTRVVGDFRPDLTIVLDVPVEEGLRRAGHRGGGENRYERMDRGFHERLRTGFLEIAQAEPGRCVVVDATREPDKVAEDILKTVRERLPDG